MNSSLLFVSPYANDANVIAAILGEVATPFVHACNLKDAVSRLRIADFGVVLTEAHLDDGSWLDLLEVTRGRGTELVVTDPWADSEFWAKAINLGAYDLLAQPFHSTEVRRVIASAAFHRARVKSVSVA